MFALSKRTTCDILRICMNKELEYKKQLSVFLKFPLITDSGEWHCGHHLVTIVYLQNCQYYHFPLIGYCSKSIHFELLVLMWQRCDQSKFNLFFHPVFWQDSHYFIIWFLAPHSYTKLWSLTLIAFELQFAPDKHQTLWSDQSLLRGINQQLRTTPTYILKIQFR